MFRPYFHGCIWLILVIMLILLASPISRYIFACVSRSERENEIFVQSKGSVPHRTSDMFLHCDYTSRLNLSYGSINLNESLVDVEHSFCHQLGWDSKLNIPPLSNLRAKNPGIVRSIRSPKSCRLAIILHTGRYAEIREYFTDHLDMQANTGASTRSIFFLPYNNRIIPTITAA